MSSGEPNIWYDGALRGRRRRRGAVIRTGLAAAGLVMAIALGRHLLSAGDLALLWRGWMVPAVALLHLTAQAGCSWAWRSLVAPPRPSRGRAVTRPEA